MADVPMIGRGTLTREMLAGQVVVVTGAGGGIGFEAARALCWLGARVIVAEIQGSKGRTAVAQLNEAFGSGVATSVRTDVGSERSVRRLAQRAALAYGHVDVVLNNATIAPLGAVEEVPIRTWDASYRVNLRGPVLLARAFLPGMLASKHGAFICVSSLGTAYMGAYEAMKAAQVHLAHTLAAELEGTGVSAFSIGPGFAPTETALSALPGLAASMGVGMDELRAMLVGQTISIEAAGAGFAAAIALAERYQDQEISSLQALHDAGIALSDEGQGPAHAFSAETFGQIRAGAQRVRETLAEQSAEWADRSIFERQWLIRTFRSRAGMPVEGWLEALAQLEHAAAAQDAAGVSAVGAPLDALAGYYAYLGEMAKGYAKDAAARDEQLAIVRGWQEEVKALASVLEGG
jgi:NAD(P)-dependent dehydrogenase (short-subunit alcohol dehydrogenase family)